MKPILMVVAPRNFRDEELFDTRREIENAGIKVVLASVHPGECIGSKGGSAFAKLGIDEVNSNEYDAVVFVGGSGSRVFFNNTSAHRMATEMLTQGKIVGAICIAPIILGEARLLKDKKVTVYQSEIDTIEKLGAHYTGEAVTQDGLIITCSGPEHAPLFGKTIARAIKLLPVTSC